MLIVPRYDIERSTTVVIPRVKDLRRLKKVYIKSIGFD